VPGKLFDKLRGVNPAKRGIERPRRACPVLTGWTGNFIHEKALTGVKIESIIISFRCKTRGAG